MDGNSIITQVAQTTNNSTYTTSSKLANINERDDYTSNNSTQLQNTIATSACKFNSPFFVLTLAVLIFSIIISM